MAKKLLMKGNEAIAEAALRAGCKCYFGYPITPQTEVAHYLAKKMPSVEGGVFVQAESEVSAINMVYGAASTGARVMTTSSSPGISLKQEGLSYIAGAELPVVIVNIVRAGPGLGGILPAQCDYFQAVKGGGHGGYKTIVVAPSSVQELYEWTVEAFNLSDKYRITTMILGDGILGQMMEPVEFREKEDILKVEKPWACTGSEMKREHNMVTSIYINPDQLEAHNNKLHAKYKTIEENEVKFEEYNCEGAEVIFAAYGTTARICKNVIEDAAKDGIKLGLIRPITLWPFPSAVFEKYADQESTKAFLSVELSAGKGQMIEDVQLAVKGKKPVEFYGRSGGNIPSQAEIYNKIKEILG